MDQSTTIARHFARLVWLLVREPANVDEQKALLRALVMVAKGSGATLELAAGYITANGAPLAPALAGVPEVAERMTARGVAAIVVDVGATPADLLGAARTLAAVPSGEPSSAPGPTVRFLPRGALPDIDFGEVVDDPLAPARTSVPAAQPAPVSVRAVPEPPRGPATPAELLERLDTETDPRRLLAVIDELARAAEDAAHDGKSALASDTFHRIVRREREIEELEIKRALSLAVTRLASSGVLQAVAAELALAPDRRDDYVAVLTRAGDAGADALIEQLGTGGAREARAVYFDALTRLPAGVPTLIGMLGDPRWHVARTAATLLGEMQAVAAEKPLSDLLHHDDERVRHAATISLMRLGTTRAMQTIQDAFKDRAPQIRIAAAAALVQRKDVRTAAMLLRALDDEKDDEVSAAYLIALGRLATGDAVDRLIATAEANRGLFRKKPVALRVAAVQGLAEARTPEAIATLRALQQDKDEDVQATAVYALGRTARRSPAK